MKVLKLSPADQRFIEKFFTGADTNLNAQKNEIAVNRFSGESVTVTPLVNQLIKFVYSLSEAFDKGNTDTNVQRVHKDLKATNSIMNYDRARMLVLKLDSAAYSTILD